MPTPLQVCSSLGELCCFLWVSSNALMYWDICVYLSEGGDDFTFACVSVSFLCRSPGKIIVEFSTALTVWTSCVVPAVTLKVHLFRHKQEICPRYSATATNTEVNISPTAVRFETENLSHHWIYTLSKLSWFKMSEQSKPSQLKFGMIVTESPSQHVLLELQYHLRRFKYHWKGLTEMDTSLSCLS